MRGQAGTTGKATRVESGPTGRADLEEAERRRSKAAGAELATSPRLSGGGRFAPIPSFSPIPEAAPPPPPPPAPAPVALPVSRPEDPLEREADVVADQVLRRLGAAPGGIGVDPPTAPSSAGAPVVQRASIVEVAGEALGLVPREEARGALIVDDVTSQLSPGQWRKTRFLTRLREVACETAERELSRVGRTAQGCPYIETMLARYAARPAAMLERAIRRYAPEVSRATRAEEYFAPVASRLARGIAEWARTGRLPDGLPDELRPGRLGDFLAVGAALGQAAVGIGRALFKKKPGAAGGDVDGPTLAARLGPGEPLGGEARSRMEWAFGRGFGDVRVHVDDEAADLARELEARAFTVGGHVAFGHGEYRPGTLAGDALLAHELAHVAQQTGATVALPDAALPAAEATLEEDADAGAVGAMVALHAPGPEAPRERRPVRPRLNSAPRLARCPSKPVRTAADLSKIETGPATPVATGFEITGTPRGATDRNDTIFFDRGSSIPDEDEIMKIEMLVYPGLGDLQYENVELQGSVSDDEPAALAAARAKHVAELLKGWGHGGKRKEVPLPEAGKGIANYRSVRVVRIVKAGAPAKASLATTETVACDEAVFEKARSKGAAMVKTAVDTVKAFPLSTDVKALFELTLGAPADAARVATVHENLTNLHTHLEGRVKSADGHKCGTMKERGCQTGVGAHNEKVGANAVIVLCPVFFDDTRMNDDMRAELMVHEASHGTVWKGAPADQGTIDFSYHWQRMINFLPPDARMENTDSNVMFVLGVQPGAATPHLGPTKPDPKSSDMTADEALAADQAIAYTEWRILNAFTQFGGSYRRVTMAVEENAAVASPSPFWDPLSAAFGLTPSGGTPLKKSDQVQFAGIVDRLGSASSVFTLSDVSMFDLMGGEPNPTVTLEKSTEPTKWDDGPGRRVKLGPDFFTAGSGEAQVQVMLTALLRAVRGGIPEPLIPKYLALIEDFRRRRRGPLAP